MKKCFEQPDKKRFTSKKDAEAAILLMDINNLKSYRCDCCGDWHLASKKPKIKF
jgi:hypothetical protein